MNTFNLRVQNLPAYFFCSVVLLSMASCTKNDSLTDPTSEAQTPEIELSTQPEWMPSVIYAYNNESSLMYRIRNNEDDEDEKVNRSMFVTAATLLRMASNDGVALTLLEASGYDAYGDRLVESFFDDQSFSLSQFNEYASLVSTGAFGVSQTYDDLVAAMDHPSGQYYPSIYYMNQSAPLDNGLIIAIAEELNAVEGEEEMDYIAGWHMDVSGNVTEIMLEENSLPETRLLIIGNGTTDFVSLEEFNPEPEGARSISTYIADEYRIAHRYEKSNHSEFFSATRGQATGGGYYSNGTGYLIKDIHKNNINTTYYNDVTLWTYSTEAALQVSYERDWYASNKTVIVPGWNTLPLYVRMKYSNEFYQRFWFDLNPPTPVTSNEKGLLRVKF